MFGGQKYAKLETSEDEVAREVAVVPRVTAALLAVATVGAAFYSPSGRTLVARTTFAAGMGLSKVGSAVQEWHADASVSELEALVGDACECSDAMRVAPSLSSPPPPPPPPAPPPPPPPPLLCSGSPRRRPRRLCRSVLSEVWGHPVA